MPRERHVLICNDFNNLSVGKFKKGNTCGHLPGGVLTVRHSGIHLTLVSQLVFPVDVPQIFFFRTISLYFSKLNNISLALNQLSHPFRLLPFFFFNFFTISFLFTYVYYKYFHSVTLFCCFFCFMYIEFSIKQHVLAPTEYPPIHLFTYSFF